MYSLYAGSGPKLSWKSPRLGPCRPIVPPIFSGASGRWSYGLRRSLDLNIFVDWDLRRLDRTPPRDLKKSSSLEESSPAYTDLLQSAWYGVVDLPACPAYKLFVPPYTLSVSNGRLYGFTEELNRDAPVSLYV